MKLIDKDALVAEIEKCYNECLKRAKIIDSEYWNAKADAYRNVLVILENTTEVKEADLKNEYTEEVYSHLDSIKDTADRMTSGNFMHNRAAIKFSANTIAKVLQLMGLKVQKGE